MNSIIWTPEHEIASNPAENIYVHNETKWQLCLIDNEDEVAFSYSLVVTVDDIFDVIVDTYNLGVDWDEIDWTQEWDDFKLAAESCIDRIVEWKNRVN